MKRMSCVVVAVAVCMVAVCAQGSTFTWNAGGGSVPNSNNNWSNGNNWQGGAAPSSGADVVFNSWGITKNGNGSLVATLDSSLVVGNMLIEGWFDTPGTGYATNYNAILLPAGQTYTLTVNGNLTFDDYDMNGTNGFTLSAVANIQGQLLGITDIGRGNPRGDQPDELSNVLNFTASGNTIGGGINAVWESFNFAGNNNTFNGGVTLSGFNAYSWRNIVPASGASWSAGHVTIAGTGNTFGAGAINLNQYGSLTLQTAQDLSNITAINFNGGSLQLKTAMTALPTAMTAWNVTAGQLIVGSNVTNSVLGSPSLPVNLGGANSFGTLVGGEYLASGTAGPAGIANPITLNGNGGILDADIMDFGAGWGTVDYYWLDVNGAISGTGKLIKRGGGWTDFTGSTPNTYSGGTVIPQGRLLVGSNTSLGTGNVTVTGGGWLSLTAAGNVASGASVLVQASGNMNYNSGLEPYVWYAQEEFPRLDLMADVMPTIDPASNGVIWLDTNVAAGGAISNALHAAAPGNGTMFIGGGWPNGSNYYGTSIAPGAGNTIRFGGGPIGGINIQSTCLVGDANVLVVGGGISSWANQTFTGKLTVKGGVTIDTWGSVSFGAFGVAGGTCLGAATGNVELDAGQIYYNVNGGNAPLTKNDLSYSGTGGVVLYTPTSTSPVAEMDFSTLTRVGKSFFTISLLPQSYQSFGGPAGRTKFVVTGGMTNTNGMVDPYIVFTYDAANTGDFLAYDPTSGFAAVSSYPALPATGGAGTEIASSAGQALTGPVNVWALKATGAITGGQTLTLGSGGLIVVNNATSLAANFVAGNGTADMVVYANGGTGGSYDSINGTITAGAMVKGGPGTLTLGANNTGTLNGDIYIDRDTGGVQSQVRG